MTDSSGRAIRAFDAIVELGEEPATAQVQAILSELDTTAREQVETLLVGMADISLDVTAPSKIGRFAADSLTPETLPAGTVLDHTSEDFQHYNPPLPPFEIVEPFAAGGQAQLYKARSLKPINGTYMNPETVVIKTVKRRETVLAEATLFHIALLLNYIRETDIHPSLYFDANHDVAFYAMPQFDVDLTSFARHNPTMETKLEILFQLARFIDRANTVIIHRDIKPANIFLKISSRGKINQVVLGDFGIATIRPGMLRIIARFFRYLGLISAMPPSHDVSTAYTPAYAAPEAVESAPPTAAMDTYSYAVTAFELLTGELPNKEGWPTTDVKARSLPKNFWALFTRALADDPGERYETCFEMYLHLSRVLHFEPKCLVRDKMFDRRKRHGVRTPDGNWVLKYPEELEPEDKIIL